MNRTRGILIAGVFTGLALIAVLALGLGSARADSADSAAGSPVTSGIVAPVTDNMDGAQAVEAWRTYSAELEQTVRTMQEREAAYLEQISLANQTILQLQDQINQSNSLAGAPSFGEHESEEHESEEGEGHWFGEFDD